MSKINLDKYYTQPKLAEYCVNKTKEVIGEENITEWIEPSAGGGVFLPFLGDNFLAFDIEPEAENIIEANYLELNIPYLKGRCIIGNPPFGRSNNLATQFFKKAITHGDYISFILPVSQLNNTIRLYEFDLIYSEKLEEIEYSGVKLKCCLNIYKRPGNGLNKRPNYNLKDVTIIDHRSPTNPIPFDTNIHDFRFCAWGRAIGKEVNYQKYAREYCIKVNKLEFRSRVIEVLRGANWSDNISTPNLCIWQVYKYLKEQIPELE